MNKKRILISLVLSLFWLGVIHLWGSKHYTFVRGWQDNVSQISSAFLFTVEGFGIYTKPTGDSLKPLPQKDLPPRFKTDVNPEEWFWHPEIGKEKPVFMVWPNIPRPYPLGAYVWYAPYSLIVYGLNGSMALAAALSTFVFLLIAHVCFFIYYDELRKNILSGSSHKDTFLRVSFYFLMYIIYAEFIRWSGQGQYDLIAMIPLIFAYKAFKKEDYPFTLFLYGVALSIHFRTLFSLGLVLLATFLILVDLKKHLGRGKNRNIVLISAAALMAGISAFIFINNISHLTDTTLYSTNEFLYSSIGKKSVPEIILFFVFLFGLLYWFFKNSLWPQLSVALSTLLILFSTALIRGWYVMFLFPIFLLIDPKDKRKKAVFYASFLFYIFSSSTFMNQSPFNFSFFRELIEIYNGVS
jgi:hypothetical protein